MSDSVMVRDIAVGGGTPVSIQSMTNVDSRDEKALMRQIRELEDAGCEIIRISVPDMEALETFREVRKKTKKMSVTSAEMSPPANLSAPVPALSSSFCQIWIAASPVSALMTAPGQA